MPIIFFRYYHKYFDERKFWHYILKDIEMKYIFISHMRGKYYYSLLKFLEAISRFNNSSLNIVLEYWGAYIHSFNKLMDATSVKTNITFDPNSIFHPWLKITDLECHKHLHSSQFLGSLNEYVDSAIYLWSLSEKVINGSSYLLTYISKSADYPAGKFADLLASRISESHFKVICSCDEVRLLHYYSSFVGYSTPVLIVYAPINRYHIMDIAKGRSIVEQFLLAGFDVFLSDWGREQNKNTTTISDYIVCIDHAIEQV